MADDFKHSVVSPVTFAADDVSGVLYPRNKVSIGADGEATDLDFGQATKAGSLPVVLASDSDPTAVVAASLPLPAGAAQDDTVVLLRRIVKLLESGAVVDASMRQRIAVETFGVISTLGVNLAATAVNTPSIGAPVMGAAVYWQPVWTGPVDQRWQIIDQARAAYNTGIRSNLTWL